MRHLTLAVKVLVVAGCLIALSALPGACQGGGPEDLDLGILGGMGGLGGGGGLAGLLGGLGGLRGVAGAGMGAAPAAPPVVIVTQPVMLFHGDSLYIAWQGKVMRFDAVTLRKQAEGVYGEALAVPQQAGTMFRGSSTGPQLLQDAPAAPRPPLVPGARPVPGP